MSKYSWAKALAPGHMGMGVGPAAAWGVGVGGGGPGPGQGLGPGPAPPMPICPGAKALAHEYFDIWAHKYF